jgi:hypothetical protein
MQKSILAASLIFLVSSVMAATVPQPVIVKQETDTFDLSLKYPQGFVDKNIDERIKEFIEEMQKADLNPDAKSGPNVPGKNSLYIDYKIKYQTNDALSLLFMISINQRGAAHPNNMVKSLNFLNAKEISLNELFRPESNYLGTIAKLSKQELLKKKISDENWIDEGTKPTEENYRHWYFTANGLRIVFDTYQVAAYVYGPQEISLTKSELKSMLRPEIIKAIWGSQ